MANADKSKHRWTVVDDAIIAVSGPGDMVDADWNAFLKDLQEKPVKKYLQYTPGATPLTSTQRKNGFDTVQSKNLDKVVMVTDSAVVRGVVTAASWFGVKVASWRVSQLPEAVAALGLSDASQKAVIKAIQELSKDF
jgi:hypothetical protein